jgi:hypothetical protein
VIFPALSIRTAAPAASAACAGDPGPDPAHRGRNDPAVAAGTLVLARHSERVRHTQRSCIDLRGPHTPAVRRARRLMADYDPGRTEQLFCGAATQHCVRCGMLEQAVCLRLATIARVCAAWRRQAESTDIVTAPATRVLRSSPPCPFDSYAAIEDRQIAERLTSSSAAISARRQIMRSSSKKPRLRSKAGMSQPRFPSAKSVEVIVTLRAYRDQAQSLARDPSRGSRSTARSVTTTRMPSWPLPRC